MQEMPETRVQFLGQEDLLEWEMATTPVFLPGKFHGQRSLVGCSPWGAKVHGVTRRRTRLSAHTHCVYGMACGAQPKGSLKVDICLCCICKICSMGVGLTHETGATSEVVICIINL